MKSASKKVNQGKPREGEKVTGLLEEVRFELRQNYRVKPGMWVSGSECSLQREWQASRPQSRNESEKVPEV